MSGISSQMSTKHTNEVRNLTFPYVSEVDAERLSEYRVEGVWWELLAELRLSLAVSREYEHLLYLIHSDAGAPLVSVLELPHPSGICYDGGRRRLIVSSTRTPNQLIEFRLIEPGLPNDLAPETAVHPDGSLFVPVLKYFLAGSLYTHDVALIDDELCLTATGHNFLARVLRDGGWERVWWPRCLDRLDRDRFNQNYLQLNSVTPAGSIDDCFFTAFADETTGPKPWKGGFGPTGKGVVFRGATRDVIARGLTCPHSARVLDDRVWLCNSGYGEVGFLEPGQSPWKFEAVLRLPGFTRGLAFAGRYGFVGLSKIIPSYERYAPGVPTASSQCGVVAFDRLTGERVASLTWTNGYQIYDVQGLPGLVRPLLPSFAKGADGINHYLRFHGWDLNRVGTRSASGLEAAIQS